MRPFICEPLGRLCLADAPLLGLTEFHLWACPSRLGGKLFLGNYASKMAYRLIGIGTLQRLPAVHKVQVRARVSAVPI